MSIATDTAMKHLTEQREYVKKRHLDAQKAVASRGGTSGLVDEKILAESMRSVRYRDEGHAAGDIADNAIEAGATQFHVIFKTAGNAIEGIAFVDDGSGIDPTFLPHATKWGGSSNEGRRNTFGRFGFGLPSASVNRGRMFEVISRVSSDDPFLGVTIDLDNLTTSEGVVPLPEVTERELPSWISAYLTKTVDGRTGFTGGLDAVRTVVVWSKLDRLQWPNKAQAAARFLEHFGITYASWLGVVRLVVDGVAVDPVDVLFTTPDSRWYDIEGYPRAEAQDPITFSVPDTNGVSRDVTVRFSYLSKAAYDAAAQPSGRGRLTKIRQRIRSNYNGIFVTRHQRFIELANPSIITWNNYARQVGIALDFPPELDELFGVTPDKQTIMFTHRLVSLLESHGVSRAFRSLYALVEEERHRLKAERDVHLAEGDTRPSEETIAKVVELDVRRTRKTNEETREEAERNLRERAKRLSEESGLPEEEIVEAQEKKHAEKPYRVEHTRQTVDDAFFTPYMEGTQLVLRINTGHPWYQELYGKLGPDDAEFRSGLELMLWVLATSEIDSTGDARIFYRSERAEWSRLLANAFELHPVIFSRVSSREELDEEDPEPWAEDSADEEVGPAEGTGGA
jgi:hypothetical protein